MVKWSTLLGRAVLVRLVTVLSRFLGFFDITELCTDFSYVVCTMLSLAI